MQKSESIIKDELKLIEVFQVINWLDDKRWNQPGNYDSIHYFKDKKELSPAKRLLTHWLCYITDRQTPFEQVWIKGGFVFSELVYNFVKEEDIKSLLDESNENSFYKNKKDLKKEFDFKEKNLSHMSKGKLKDKYTFVSRTKRGNKRQLFSSRFITDDYQMIKTTLITLDKHFERDFIKFLETCISSFKNQSDFVMRTAAALHLLTYQFKRGNKKFGTEEFDKNFDEEKKFDNKKFEKYFEKFKKTSTKDKKRTWCSIRDYLKEGSEFQGYVMKGLKPEYRTTWENASKKMMDQLEIPGDVWNNNPLFADNLLKNLIDETDNKKISDIIRKAYEELKNKLNERKISFYPEQFDLTFDFVPRMCSSPNNKVSQGSNCNICPFGNGVLDYCHQNPEKNCPVVAYSCGYIAKCEPESCPLKDGIAKQTCKTMIKE